MNTIVKKIDTEWFDDILDGTKDYELRLADFDIQEGDILCLEEWTGVGEERMATGRVLEKVVTHVRKVDLNKWIELQPELIEKGFYVIRF
jgi:hypothetical protein